MWIPSAAYSLMRVKSDSTRLVQGIIVLVLALLSNHSLQDWTPLSEWSFSTLTFNNPASIPSAIPRPPNYTLMSSMSSSNTFAHRQSFWHALNVSKKSHGIMKHTRPPWTNYVCISSSGIAPILSTPCATTELATTSVWRTAVIVFRPQWYGAPVSVLGLCLLYLN